MTIHATRGLFAGFVAPALVVAVLVLGGCTFDDAPLEALTCTTDADCDGGRTCVQGYCIEVEGTVCASDTECSDGLFCNGDERCDPDAGTADGCVAGAAPALSDGYDCTEDICDEAAGEVRHIRGNDCICANEQDHQACVAVAQRDGLVCVAPSCNDQLGCDFPLVPVDTACGEANGCIGVGICDAQGACQQTPDDSMCDDQDACNGAETCGPGGSCEPGVPMDTDDGVACTVDSCTDGVVSHDASACPCQEPGAACDCVGDGCQPVSDCRGYICSESYTCSAPDVAFMPAGTMCSDGATCTFDDECDGTGRCAGTLDDNLCSNFDLCDGEEICDPTDADRDVNGCVGGVPPNINDGIVCTVDSCEGGVIMHIPMGCALCETDQECQPVEDGNACLRYFCDEICMTEPQPQGTMCDDERSCTQTDACDANAQCIGADPSDVLCNDQMWCDGIEICQPNHPNADGDGCRSGVAPDPNDNVACTADTCVECDPQDPNCDEGLEGELVNTPTDQCECVDDGDCAEMADVCFVGTCTEGTYTCAIAPAPVDTVCDDGLPCTDGDRCDANQNCVPVTDNCDCEADADCTDDDDNVCILSGTCDEGVCQYTFASDDTACGDVACTAGSTCDGAGACDLILDHDACAGACRAGAMCDPDNGDTEGCVYEPANEGACVVNCGNGDIDGTCVVGACQAPPEGPTGADSCGNETDDDCDGAIDDADSDCVTPDTVTVGGDDTGTVGAPAILTIEAADGGDDATNQAENLYCVGRVERYFEGFDAASVIENIDGDDNIAPIGTLGDDVASGVTYEGATGMKICNGKGVLLGPFAQPPIADEVALMLRIRMASMNPNGLGVNERFVVSYRNAVTGTDGEQELYVPTVALDELDSAPRDYQNVFYNGGGIGAVTVRLELVSTDGSADANQCAFVDSVGMYAVPFYRTVTDQVPEDLTYLQWTWDGTTEDAEMEFEPADGAENDIEASFFTQVPPGQSLRLEGRAKHTDTKGLQWDNGGADGSIILPPVTATPVDYDRSESVRLDWAMSMRNMAVWAQGDAVDAVFGIGLDVLSYRKIGSAFPLDAPAQYVSQYEAGPDRDGTHKARHRYVVELPEEMKPLLGRTLAFARKAASAGDASAFLDDIDLHTRHNDLYMTFAGTGPQGYDSPVHEVALTSQLAGRVHVQCYWQLPETADTPTIASAPYYVTITE